MKNISALICVLLTFNSFCKEKVALPTPFEFKIIDSIQGNQNELFVQAMEWMSKTFNSSKSVIQFSDKESGKIIGKAIIGVGAYAQLMGNYLCEANVKYTITITIKDGKYKCELSDFYHEGCYGNGTQTGSGGNLNRVKSDYDAMRNIGLSQKRFDEVKTKTMKEAELLLLSLKSFMYESKKQEDGF